MPAQILTSLTTVHYAKVIDIDTCSQSILLEASSPFSDNDVVAIIQMKGAEFDTTISQSFGRIIGANSAGRFEFLRIRLTTGKWCNYSAPLQFVYKPQMEVQLCSVVSGVNIAVDTTMYVRKYTNGVGGIVVLRATDTLFLHSDILAEGSGFSGGSASISGFDTNRIESVFTDLAGASGYHGETVAQVKPNVSTGRNSVCTGGGGGNARNSGGGGGANSGDGGNGGFQTSEYEQLDIGGLGGKSLGNSSFDLTVHPGGGGGGGQQNDFLGTAGGSGGGIVILIADFIKSKSNVVVNARGLSAFDSRDDGAGGGGAGGTVIIDAGAATDLVTVDVSGGNGGNADGTIRCYGPGGGGGGGVVWADTSTLQNLYCVLDGGIGGSTFSPDSICSPKSNYGSNNGNPGSLKLLPENITYFSRRKNVIVYLTRDSICEGDYDTLVVENGSTIVNFPFGKRISENPDTIVIGPVSATMKLSIPIVSTSGCLITDSVTINMQPLPMPVLTVSDTIVGSELDTVEFATTKMYSRYEWSNGDTNPSTTVVGNNAIQVRVWSEQGCSGLSLVSTVKVSRIAGTIQLEIGDVSGAPGDTVQVPILIRVLDTLTVQAQIEVEISTDASCLIPIDGPLNISNQRILMLKKFTLDATPPDSFVYVIPMMCALGESINSKISINTISALPPPVQIEPKRDGELTLTKVCLAGDAPRLFSPYARVLRKGSPEPINIDFDPHVIDSLDEQLKCASQSGVGFHADVSAVSINGNEIPVHLECSKYAIKVSLPIWVSGLVAIAIRRCGFVKMSVFWID
ncbi:MAG: hypothetical protein HQ472_07740 [Ignavibacteria bacterium]|nr:hypothetical protein [Ignavibacteria bacterium]